MPLTSARTAAPAATVTSAAVLIGASSADAKVFTVSRDVTLYAKPDTTEPLRSYPAGGRVDVRCYTRGQPIDGYEWTPKVL